MKDSTFFACLGIGLGFGGIFLMNRNLLMGAIMSCAGIYFWCAVGQKKRREEREQDRQETRNVPGD